MSTIERPLLSAPEPVPSFDVSGWALRISAAVLFLAVGLTKFRRESLWVQMFADIGFGDWFRYLTGSLQATAGALFLVPKTAPAAAALAGGTMAGAVLVHLFVLPTGMGGAVIPLALLAFVVLAARRPP
jgi:uncharacterized membrane protein YphA (DoxX/SURF4 family)